MRFMKVCALNGLGIVQLHDYMAEKELASGALIHVLPDVLLPATDLYVLPKASLRATED